VFVTGRLAILAALAALAALAMPGRSLVAVGLADLVILGVAAIDALAAPRPRTVPRERRHPPVASVGGEVEVTLLVTNRAGRPVRVAVRDAAVPSLAPDPRRPAALLMPGTGRISYRLRPRRRGLFGLGPVTVRTWGPLGLAGRQGTVDLRTQLKVYPELRGRQQVEGRVRRSRLLEAGTRSARVRGGGLEFEALRDYHPDDEFRRINWAATARAGKPISNVYREERNQQVLLLLDAGRAMAGTIAGAPRFEHAFDAAVALATLAVEVGDRVGTFAFDQRLRGSVPPRADRGQPGRIVDALFRVEPAVVSSDLLGSVGGILARHRRRALLVLFTDLADEGAVEPLMRAVPVLARRHLVLLAEVTDPEVARLARVFPSSADQAFVKASAAGTEHRREQAARILARSGVEVVDRPPGELALALADAYLRVKAFGRL
jgi:uncharacterized protein (DUF58 family)